MEPTRSQVEEVRLKRAFILQGSRESHKVVIGFRPMWKFLSPSRKCSIFCCTKIISPLRMSALGRKLNFDASCGMMLV